MDVFDAEAIPGGASRTLDLTLPGFRHDFGSAVYPLGIGSPFFASLPLARHGLEWIHSPAALAHPLDDGTAVMLERGLAASDSGVDGRAWDALTLPFARRWPEFAPDVLHALPFFPKNPLLMARFGVSALRSARAVAGRFRSDRTKALFAGLAAHSFLTMEEPIGAAVGMMMAISARAVGWPVPRGGAQSIANALIGYLETLGGTVTTSSRVESLAQLGTYDVTMCDVTPRQLEAIAGDRLSDRFRRSLKKYRYGMGVFKVDYALSRPIPWAAPECARAATVHLGGSFDDIADSERAIRNGSVADRPFVLLAQPSLFDDTRAPVGRHTAWAYCHVPHGYAIDVLDNLERQIERFAPGFTDCVMARRVFFPSAVEAMDANLIGGDIGGGVLDLRQFVFRPTRRHYATSARDIYICSASTPPGGGVHGMCGYHAAKAALASR